MAAAGKLWLLRCVFMSCSSSCRVAEQVITIYHTMWWGKFHEHLSRIEIPEITFSVISPLPRFFWLCQQLALFPVDTCAAVHQPCGPSAPLLPPALPLPALASWPQNWRCAEEHRPRHLFHQHPAQVRGNKMVRDTANTRCVSEFVTSSNNNIS